MNHRVQITTISFKLLNLQTTHWNVSSRATRVEIVATILLVILFWKNYTCFSYDLHYDGRVVDKDLFHILQKEIT